MNVMIVANGIPLYTTPLLGIFEFDQALALAEYGHNVCYFALDFRSIRHIRKWGFTKGNTQGISWIKIDFPLGRVPHSLLRFVGEVALKQMYKDVYRDNRPDIIHSHVFTMGAVAEMIAKKYHIKHIVTEHSSRLNNNIIKEKYLKIIQKLYSQVDGVIAVSKALSDNIRKNTGIAPVVIPNVVREIGEFNCNREVHDGFYFVTTCNLIRHKRPDLLILAFSSIHAMYPNSFLEIIGNGPLFPQLCDLVDKLNLKGIINFRGIISRKEIANIYRHCDCFVLPSIRETFGVAYVEALASGLPVIATRCGGPEDFITSDNGLLIDVDNLNVLIDAMRYMYENAKEYDSGVIIKSVQDKYCDAAVARRISDYYYKILSL